MLISSLARKAVKGVYAKPVNLFMQERWFWRELPCYAGLVSPDSINFLDFGNVSSYLVVDWILPSLRNMSQISLDVFVVNPFLQGNTPNPAFTESDIRWLFDSANKRSLTRYWTEVSGGLFEIDATVLPVLDVEVSAASLSLLTMPGGRGGGLGEAIRLLTENRRKFEANGKAVIFVGGFPVDAGTDYPVVNNQIWNVAYFDMIGEHSFMAHELGHVLGLDHPYDLRLPGPAVNQEYCDPADIMSAQWWAGTNPAFNVPAIERGFAPTAALWTRCGPGASPITFWRYGQTFPAEPSWVRKIAADAPPSQIAIARAGRPIATGIHLIVMPGDRGASWYSVQYKAKQDWDTNIYPRFGPVKGILQVHELRDVVWPEVNGTAPVVVGAPCLIAELPLPGGDLDWSNGRLSLRVESFNEFSVNLLVGHFLPQLRSLSLDLASESTGVSTQPSGESVELSRTGPQCRIQTYQAELHLSEATLTATAQSRGFDNPVFRFEANNLPLGGWVAGPPPSSGTVHIMVTLSRPTSLKTSTVENKMVLVFYTLSGNSLTLTTQVGEGQFDIAVKALVSEAPGDDTTAIESTKVVTVTTRSISLPTVAIQDQTACLVANLNSSRTDWRWIIPLEDPEWQIALNLPELLARRNFAVVGPALIRIIEGEAQGSPAAAHLFAEAASLLDVSPQSLREAGRHFPSPTNGY